VTATVAECFGTDALDLETVVERSQRTDPRGVLAIYLAARPGALHRRALNQTRVAHFAYDPVICYRGSVGHDGSLYGRGRNGPDLPLVGPGRATLSRTDSRRDPRGVPHMKRMGSTAHSRQMHAGARWSNALETEEVR
jgi:hypothetical protein